MCFIFLFGSNSGLLYFQGWMVKMRAVHDSNLPENNVSTKDEVESNLQIRVSLHSDHNHLEKKHDLENGFESYSSHFHSHKLSRLSIMMLF